MSTAISNNIFCLEISLKKTIILHHAVSHQVYYPHLLYPSRQQSSMKFSMLGCGISFDVKLKEVDNRLANKDFGRLHLDKQKPKTN